MRYFENAHERSVFREKANSQLKWYRDKIKYCQEQLIDDPRAFSFNDYMMYVRECKVLEDYVAALDAEDIADGVVLCDYKAKPVVPANLQKEAVLSSLVVELSRRLNAVQDSISFLEASGSFANMPSDVCAALTDMRGASIQGDTYVMSAARSLAEGYKVVPVNDPLLPEWDDTMANPDLKELMCMLYDINYNFSSPSERSDIERQLRLWYNAIRRALS